jgi:hypothetical protein
VKERPPPAAVTAVAAATALAAPAEENDSGNGKIPGFESFWQVIEAWSESIDDGSADLTVPNPVKNQIKKRYSSNKKEVERVINSFEMIPWIYTAVRENEEARSVLASAMCEMVWDEYLKQKEQYILYKLAYDNDIVPTLEISEEHQVRSGSQHGYRSINPKTGILEYICEEGPCSPALVKVFEDDDSDILKGLKANNEVSAPLYGSVTYKRGAFVFKTNKPVSKEKKHPDKGSECAIVSTVAAHRKTLAEIGEMARASIGTDFDLNTETLENRRPFKNSARFCALTDLALRMINKLDDTKLWFYRPIAAFKSGHKGEKSA